MSKSISFGLAAFVSIWATVCMVGAFSAYTCFLESDTTCLITDA